MSINGIMLRMTANRERKQAIQEYCAQVDRQLGSWLDAADRGNRNQAEKENTKNVQAP